MAKILWKDTENGKIAEAYSKLYIGASIKSRGHIDAYINFIEKKILSLHNRIKELEIAENKLIALENAGVDNWSGYSYAMEELENIT